MSDVYKREKWSDGCPKDCWLKNPSGKCVFETCIFGEIPPMQEPTAPRNCIICGETINYNLLDNINQKYIVSICPTCMEHLKKAIDAAKKWPQLDWLLDHEEDIEELVNNKSRILAATSKVEACPNCP